MTLLVTSLRRFSLLFTSLRFWHRHDRSEIRSRRRPAQRRRRRGRGRRRGVPQSAEPVRGHSPNGLSRVLLEVSHRCSRASMCTRVRSAKPERVRSPTLVAAARASTRAGFAAPRPDGCARPAVSHRRSCERGCSARRLGGGADGCQGPVHYHPSPLSNYEVVGWAPRAGR